MSLVQQDSGDPNLWMLEDGHFCKETVVYINV
jgi:hypothetical protein